MKSNKTKVKSTKAMGPAERARLCVDYSEVNSFQAISILREAGFRVTATPVSGLAEPELTIGSTNYHGITEIQELLRKVGKARTA